MGFLQQRSATLEAMLCFSCRSSRGHHYVESVENVERLSCRRRRGVVVYRFVMSMSEGEWELLLHKHDVRRCDVCGR